ncbi:cysteine-rich receptor-like protein kinase 29 [Actinidia eriantha]|uniref:cysteine-rich receptor-like protein kinase 29 n=1 Tax=Actinidia eriantha TaxID=165200 RepID=UPI0025911B43|nr:cysteine-rich receptor-like protein kinase 29 [Actinidia eriantha]
MGTSNFPIIVSCIITILPLTTAQFCFSEFNFTASNTFIKTRNLVLSSLASNVSANSGFYGATLALDSDTLYTFGLCRGDLSNNSCFPCIRTASQSLIDKCPNHKEATGIEYSCMVRYSNRPFFNVMDTHPARSWQNPNNVSANHMENFNWVLNRLVDEMIVRVVASSSILKFTTGDNNFTVYDSRIYALMQCVPTLSSGNCADCLRGAVGDYRSLYMGTEGVNIWTASCIFRYEVFPFLESKVGAAPPPPPTPVTLVLTPPPPLPPPPPTNTTMIQANRSNTYRTTIIIVGVILSIILLVIALCAAFFLLRKKEEAKRRHNSGSLYNLARVRAAAKIFWTSRRNGMHQAGEDETQSQSTTSLRFDFVTLRAATNDFSNGNILGGGGFGSVYKGQLPNGQEIAVKRLVGGSKQGQVEFKNEAMLVARLQHKNLVRLLGFCLEGEERLIVYEFVPNGSLDRFIFDPTKRMFLNWEMRYKIIVGIVEGLVYLHQDSQLRIIHHDLKAGNVLLDGKMNAKIADFGLARLFLVDQSRGNTKRIGGTVGYMPPEYAKYGQFSMKTDVFSFGVLVLEIVSGKRSNDCVEHLISYAWKKWRQGKASRLIDQTLRGGSESEKMRCIHIGLLCVQENVAKRPTMASVALMLNSFSMSLPLPRKPAFLMQSSAEPNVALTEKCPSMVTSSDQSLNLTSSDQSLEYSINSCVNEDSITLPR